MMNTNLAPLPTAPKIDMRKIPALAKQYMSHTNLPENYIAAKKALIQCSRVDQCKDIVDKHSAIAHYAKQVKDDTLLYYAERIRLRALIRLGELMEGLPEEARKKAAKNNNISQSHAKWARDAASIPQRDLDKMIETTPPPSLKRLSAYWRDRSGQYTDVGYNSRERYFQLERKYVEDPAGNFIMIMEAIENLLSAMELAVEDQDSSYWLRPTTFERIAGSVPPRELPMLLKSAEKARAFLTRLISALESKTGS